MIWTIDGNYTVEEYNKIIDTLIKKEIPFQEYISTKNYQFFIETELEPFVLDYKGIDPQFSYFLVSKTKWLQTPEKVKYTRRSEHNGKSALKLCYNDAYRFFGDDYTYFIHLSNKERAKELSLKIGRLYYFGKYLNSRYFVFLTNNQYISQFVKTDDILASGGVLDAEQQLYYQAFNRQDRLKKFSQTPYYEGGDYHRPKVLAPFFASNKSAKATTK